MAPVVALDMENISLEEKEEKEEAEKDEKQKEVEAVSRPTIGIIYPPPEVRSILLQCNESFYCNFEKN